MIKNYIPFSNMAGYKLTWLKKDFIAALVVTAIAIPESLGFAIIVGLPVQTGLYCALVAPIVFAALTSSKRLVVGADSATAALVAAGAATLAVAGTAEYSNAIAVLGLVTAALLALMSLLRFGFMADLISRPVLIGFVSGVGVQLLIGKMPEMLGLSAHGALLDKLFYTIAHISAVNIFAAILSLCVVAIVVVGWRYKYPGALIALVLAIVAAKLLDLERFGVDMVGIVPAGLPSLQIPSISLDDVLTLLPTAFSIAIVILAQSLAVIRSAAATHEEKVNDNQDLMALGAANAVSALVGGFAINGSPPRTSAGEMAGGRSQLVNVIMAGLIGVVLVVATGLFEYVPSACLAAIVFTIGLHLIKFEEIIKIATMRKREFFIALIALVAVALLGVQKGIMLAVLLSLIERLRSQYHPYEDILLIDGEYTEWSKARFAHGRNAVRPPEGLIAYRFEGALFFENASYFLERATAILASAKKPVSGFILDASAITDIDYTAAQAMSRFISQLNADDIQFSLAHVSPQLQGLLGRYQLVDLIGDDNIHANLRLAILAFTKSHIHARELVAQLQLDTKGYVVIGGAVLEMYNLRETNDVDLVVSQSVYNVLREKGWKEFVQDDGKRLLVSDGYRIMLRWMGRDVGDLQRKAQTVDDVRVMGLQDLIDCKQQLGRQKDIRDVELLRAYIAAQDTSSK